MYDSLFRDYARYIVSFPDWLAELKKTYLGRETAEVRKNEEAEKVVTVGLKYVRELIEELGSLKGIISQGKFDACRKSLVSISDFDDEEEVMSIVNETLKKNIFGSLGSVDRKEKKCLRSYLEKAGYAPVKVKEGDSMKKYIKYFAEKVPVSEPHDRSLNGTIKKIQEQPYRILYYINGEQNELQLKGMCSFWSEN